jgi:hypothetical protein
LREFTVPYILSSINLNSAVPVYYRTLYARRITRLARGPAPLVAGGPEQRSTWSGAYSFSVPTSHPPVSSRALASGLRKFPCQRNQTNRQACIGAGCQCSLALTAHTGPRATRKEGGGHMRTGLGHALVRRLTITSTRSWGAFFGSAHFSVFTKQETSTFEGRSYHLRLRRHPRDTARRPREPTW